MKNFDLSRLPTMARMRLQDLTSKMIYEINEDLPQFSEGEARNEMLGWKQALVDLAFDLKDSRINETNHVKAVTILTEMRERARDWGFEDGEPMEVLRRTVRRALSGEKIDYPSTPTAWELYSTHGSDDIAYCLGKQTEELVQILERSTHLEFVEIVKLLGLEIKVS